MTRFEYIDALRQALSGLPPDVIAATVAEYERRIVAASAAGQGEDDIMASLGDPEKIAQELRAAPPAIKVNRQEKAPLNVVRAFFSFVGVMVFNLILVVPAILYSALLIASFVVALACYAGGIAMTAASLAGISEISFDQPFDTVSVEQVQSAAAIGKDGKPLENHAAASASANGSDGLRIADGSSKIRIEKNGDNFGVTEDKHGINIDMPGLHIRNPEHSRNFFLNTGDLGESMPIRVSIGIGLILIGILSFVLCLAVGKYTLLGVVRLAQLEFSVVKNA